MNIEKTTFVDTHIHILPGIDDGARDLTESLEMAEIAVKSGVHRMIATPHCNIPGLYRNHFGEWYKELFYEVRDAIRKEQIPLELLPGMEAYVTEDLPDLLRKGKIMTLNGGRYLLLEFGFDEEPAFADRMLKQIRAHGVRPVIAHVERYDFIQDEPDIIADWRKAGDVIQVNRASFQGKFGYREEKTAYELFHHNLISVVASDAHSSQVRTPDLKEVYLELLERYPEKEKLLDVLFLRNPKRISENRPILKIQSVPFD